MSKVTNDNRKCPVAVSLHTAIKVCDKTTLLSQLQAHVGERYFWLTEARVGLNANTVTPFGTQTRSPELDLIDELRLFGASHWAHAVLQADARWKLCLWSEQVFLDSKPLPYHGISRYQELVLSRTDLTRFNVDGLRAALSPRLEFIEYRQLPGLPVTWRLAPIAQGVSHE